MCAVQSVRRGLYGNAASCYNNNNNTQIYRNGEKERTNVCLDFGFFVSFLEYNDIRPWPKRNCNKARTNFLPKIVFQLKCSFICTLDEYLLVLPVIYRHCALFSGETYKRGVKNSYMMAYDDDDDKCSKWFLCLATPFFGCNASFM